MSISQAGGSRQRELFTRAKRTTISLPDDHPLVMLTDLLIHLGTASDARRYAVQ